MTGTDIKLGGEEMNNVGHSILIIGVAAICTVFLRAVPFLIFGGKREVPAGIRYLGNYLPAAIMAILAIYCLRNVQLFRGNHGAPELIATGLVILLHSWKKNILLTVFLSTVFYMIMIQYLFI